MDEFTISKVRLPNGTFYIVYEIRDQPGEELPMNSVLPLGPFEIAQLDNDPSFPENGVLLLDVRGGR